MLSGARMEHCKVHRTASPGLAATLGHVPLRRHQPCRKRELHLRGSPIRRPTLAGLTTQSCFHYASRFCETLRLAHMLYSLARVSRRDRWRWTDHHTGRRTTEPTKVCGSCRLEESSSPPRASTEPCAGLRPENNSSREDRTRTCLVIRRPSHFSLGDSVPQRARPQLLSSRERVAIASTCLWVTSQRVVVGFKRRNLWTADHEGPATNAFVTDD